MEVWKGSTSWGALAILLYGENAKPSVAVPADVHGEMGVLGKKGVSSV